MKMKSLTFSRRTFLGGAGATIAVTAAYGAVDRFIAAPPVSVAVLLDGEFSFASLQSIVNSPLFNLAGIFASSEVLRDKASKMLRRNGIRLASSTLPLGRADITQLSASLLIFGRWEGTERRLVPVLQRSKAIYVDDPLLAMQLANRTDWSSRKQNTVVGLTSVLDPAVEDARCRLRSGLMGEFSDLAITLRRDDVISRWEAAGALHYMFDGGTRLTPRIVTTLNVAPAIHVTGVSGRLRIPIGSAKERAEMLPVCLEHFFLTARGETIPAISLRDMSSLAEEFKDIVNVAKSAR
jgi:hypothetical protein